MAHRLRKSTGSTRLGKKARAPMRWSLKANLAMLGTVAAIAIALLLLVLPTSELHAQTNSAPSVSRVSPSSPVSLTTGDRQTFQVSATDADNNLTKWEWEVDKHFSLLHGHQEPEETFTATGSITKSFSHTFPDDGTYTVTVTFTDFDGESGTAEWRAEVEDPPNRAPSVRRLSLYRTGYVATGDVTFTATATDPDDNLKSYEWFVDDTSEDDGSWLLVLPTGAVTRTFTHTFPDAGTYTVKVTFTDDEGLSASVSWTVTAVEQLTVQLGADNYTVTEGEDQEAVVTVTISGTPPHTLKVGISTYDGTARKGSDFSGLRSTVEFSPSTSLTQTVPVIIYDYNFVEPTESFSVGLERTSALPAFVTVVTDRATVTIEEDDDEATVGFLKTYHRVREDSSAGVCLGGLSGGVGIPLDVHLSYSDPFGALSPGATIPSSLTFPNGIGRGSKSCFRADFGNVLATTEVTFTLTGVTSATDAVSRRVKLAPSTATVEVIDYDILFVTRVSPSSYRVSLEAGDSQTFTARARDADNSISAYAWSVNGQERDSGPLALTGDVTRSFTHTFPDDGTYTVLVTFTDSGGVARSRSWTVEVGDSTEPANQAPSVSRVSPPQESLSLYTGETQEFRVRATDADYNLTKWEWEADWHGFALPVLDPGHIESEESFSVTGDATEDFSFTFPRDGTWTVTVTFTDVGGQSGSAAWTVDVTDGPDLAIDELELMSLKPFQEVGKIIPPATVGDSFGVELDYRHRFGPASGPFEINFYFKNPIWDFDRGIVTSFEVEPAFDPDADIPLTPSLSGPSLTFGGEGKTVIHDVDVPSSIKAGPHWFCAQIENKEQIPDPREDDNARCTLMYVVSHAKVAEWVHPVAPFDGSDGRVWYGSFYKYFDPNEFAKDLASGRPLHPDFPFFLGKDGRRISLYRHVALELAKRQAIETEGYLPYVAGVRDKIEGFSASTATMDSVLTIYGEAHNVTGVLGGSSSHAVGSLLNAAGPVLSAVNLASDGVDLHLAIIVNRAVNLDRALDTLKVLEDLPIDEDFPVAENEWHAGIRLAEQDLKDMTSGEAWREYSVAVGEDIDELAVSSLGFTVSVVAASGLTIKGIALGTAAHAIAPFLLTIPVLLEVDGALENMRLSMVAAQVYAELYQEDASGDHLETIKYAKFAAYDYLDEGYDNWIEKLLNVLFIRDTGSLRTRISESRDAALEEARAAIQLASIEFNRQHYSLKVGDVVRLEPEFKSGSGKNMIGYGVEWDVTSYDPPDTEVVAIDDTGVVTALRSGEAIIAANIGSVVGGVVVTVTSDYECVNGAVADTTNTGLVADCEALFAARDTLGGEPTLTWSEDTPITEWDGVTIGGTPLRVTGLDLQGEDLDGTIPAVLKALAKLERLDLRSNMLTGPIPEGLESLVNLRELRLSANQLIGCVPAGLRDVAVHDLGDLVIPYCDELLSSLAIDPATSLEPPFDPYHTHYTVVAEGSQVTVTPTNDHGATFEFLDGDYGALADADGSEAGHQVELTVGVTTVRVRVGGLTYTIIVAYGDPLARYDADGDNMIDKAEVIEAINDYLFGEEDEAISKAQVIELINLYLFGPS